MAISELQRMSMSDKFGLDYCFLDLAMGGLEPPTAAL